MTITEFLLARIAEDEAVARAATPGRWHADDTYGTVTAAPFTSARQAYHRANMEDECWVIAESMDSGVGDHNLTHIARHNPSRVLAECEAKRRIVRDCADYPDASVTDGLSWRTLTALAAVYADLPDFQDEWRV
jgi:hypothetical protein